MIDPNLLQNVQDQDSLVKLLETSEENGGLGWPVDTDLPFQLEPEIAAGIKGDGQVTVSRLIPATVDEKYLILLAEFEKPYVRRDLRELLSSVRRHIRTTGRFEDHTGIGDTVFIVAAPGYEDMRFVLFEERERRLPRIRSFGWRKEFIGRTVLTHNLGRLLWSDRRRWENAWDVEGLTDEFYNEFVKVFDAVKAVATHPGGEEKKHAYVQQLLNRLLFIAFIERMGWLKTPDGDSDYLHAQWLRYNDHDRYTEVQDKSLIPATFNGLLGWLFFRALDEPKGIKLSDPLYPILGEVPYLNGGLFSEEADLDVPGVTIADDVFELILGDRRPGFEGGLFRRFNFTVTESTPLDQEVAVDPEMLGKIFERIIIAEERHRTGTYYTPRPIVEFMVNEALKGYLTERGLSPEKASMLVDNDTVESEVLSFKPSEMQYTLDWLFEVRAVDPACGSGAYLLMLLQRLFELVDRLEVVRNKRRDPDQKYLYNTKLRLLQRCVYGVDISEIAVRIARLRLWLSLVIENRGEKPEPLPSFDFLIMCGDSLASPVLPTQGVLGYPHDAIREYTRLKRRYFHPEPEQHRPSREQMQAKREAIATTFQDELANSKLRTLAINPFDWEVEFAEVFDPHQAEETIDGRPNLGTKANPGHVRQRGFDIVLANPPFVRYQTLKPIRAGLQSDFLNVYDGAADLLVYFLARAFELANLGGQVVFVTSNQWLKKEYGARLRRYIGSAAQVRDIIDFGDLPVFGPISAYPAIFCFQKGESGDGQITDVPSLDAPYPDIAALRKQHSREFLHEAVTSEFWFLGRALSYKEYQKMRSSGTTLETWLLQRGTKIRSGVKTGANSQFYVPTSVGEELTQQAGEQWIAGTTQTDNVARYCVLPSHTSLILIKNGETPPGNLLQYLSPYKVELEKRSARGQQWYQLRACSFYEDFKKPHIVFPDIADRPRFALALGGRVADYTVQFIATSDLFLLGLLNSQAAFKFVQEASGRQRGGYYRFQENVLNQLPVPKATDVDRLAIGNLVRRILESKGSNPAADSAELEAEIDSRVDFLYFYADEAPTYDEWVAKKEAERGTVIEEIRSYIAEGENDIVEFKESVAWDVRQDKYSLTMRDEVLKEISAFLNADGGTILCGVHDTEGIKGLRKDLKHTGSRDKLGLLITNALGDLLRPHPVELVKMRFIEIDGETILRIDVQGDRENRYESPSTRKEDIGKNLPRTHVRIHGSAKALEGQDLINWWLRRKQ